MPFQQEMAVSRAREGLRRVFSGDFQAFKVCLITPYYFWRIWKNQRLALHIFRGLEACTAKVLFANLGPEPDPPKEMAPETCKVEANGSTIMGFQPARRIHRLQSLYIGKTSLYIIVYKHFLGRLGHASR